MSNQRYFNFPVCLLKDFLTNTKDCLNSIYDYSLYAYSRTMDVDDEYNFEGFDDEIVEFARMDIACQFYGFDMYESQIDMQLMRGKREYGDAEFHAPKTGMSLDMFWDFYHNEKTEFEKVCLLAFLAMKSILGPKAHCKTDNRFLLSRMNGSAHSHDFEKLSGALKKYTTEYQIKKIKNELKSSWSLKTYSRYTRGFYISFDMKLETLIIHAEKNRKKSKQKARQLEEKAVIDKVLKKLADDGHR